MPTFILSAVYLIIIRKLKKLNRYSFSTNSNKPKGKNLEKKEFHLISFVNGSYGNKDCCHKEEERMIKNI